MTGKPGQRADPDAASGTVPRVDSRRTPRLRQSPGALSPSGPPCQPLLAPGFCQPVRHSHAGGPALSFPRESKSRHPVSPAGSARKAAQERSQEPRNRQLLPGRRAASTGTGGTAPAAGASPRPSSSWPQRDLLLLLPGVVPAGLDRCSRALSYLLPAGRGGGASGFRAARREHLHLQESQGPTLRLYRSLRLYAAATRAA